MSSRAARFVERSIPVSAGQVVSLNTMEAYFSQVPAEIDLNEALVCAGVDADHVIESALRAVRRATANGMLEKLNLTENEALTLAAYTVEGRSGSMSMYDVLNRTLRETRDKVSMVRIRSLLVLFLRSLRKLPLVEKEKVFRGIDVNLGKSLEAGTRVTWWGFSSVTWNAAATNTFVGTTGGSLFLVEGRCRGYDLSVLSVFPDEAELLLEPETVVQIAAVVNLGPTASLIQCNIVPNKPVLQRIAPFANGDEQNDEQEESVSETEEPRDEEVSEEEDSQTDDVPDELDELEMELIDEELEQLEKELEEEEEELRVSESKEKESKNVESLKKDESQPLSKNIEKSDEEESNGRKSERKLDGREVEAEKPKDREVSEEEDPQAEEEVMDELEQLEMELNEKLGKGESMMEAGETKMGTEEHRNDKQPIPSRNEEGFRQDVKPDELDEFVVVKSRKMNDGKCEQKMNIICLFVSFKNGQRSL